MRRYLNVMFSCTKLPKINFELFYLYVGINSLIMLFNFYSYNFIISYYLMYNIFRVYRSKILKKKKKVVGINKICK